MKVFEYFHFIIILPQVVANKTHGKYNSTADMQSEKKVTLSFLIFVKVVKQIIIVQHLVEVG